MNRRFFMKMLGAAPVAAATAPAELSDLPGLPRVIPPIRMEILWPNNPPWLMSGAFVTSDPPEHEEDTIMMFKKLTPMLLMGLLGLYFY